MNIALIGSGGREHAICKKINESKLVKKIICIPGNAGTSQLATNIDADILNFNKILKLIKIYLKLKKKLTTKLRALKLILIKKLTSMLDACAILLKNMMMNVKKNTNILIVQRNTNAE